MKLRYLNYIGGIYLITILGVLSSCSSSSPVESYGVIVIGGGASGVTAGVQAARGGVNTLIIEETSWLGGMLTSAGVSCIDGNYKLPSGLFGEFRDSLAIRYGGLDSLKTGWVSHVNFEPNIGAEIFQNMVNAESLVCSIFEREVVSVVKRDNLWEVEVIYGDEISIYRAEVLIDATELGDIAAYLGVSYDIGMDSRSESKESIAPEIGNDIIQDLTYVVTLKDYGCDMTIDRPKGYDAERFYCSTDDDRCVDPKPNQAKWSKESMLGYGKLPNGRYMINWPIEGNDYYANTIEMDRAERKLKLAEAKNFTLCYLYYMQTELGFSSYSIADDIYPTDDNMPLIPYYRESRRVDGVVRFNVNHITDPFTQDQALYRTGVAVGDYPIDHHHYRHPDWEALPELHFYPVPSYSLPLGVMFPKNIKNLIVAEKSISVTNIVNGTTRLQPVVLQIGQAAGASAAIMVKSGKEVSVRAVQEELLSCGGYILPYLDVAKSHPDFRVYQRVGATGLLRGEGRNVGWENQTWLNIDSILTAEDVKLGFKDYTGEELSIQLSDSVTIGEVLDVVIDIARVEGVNIDTDKQKLYSLALLIASIPESSGYSYILNRGEYAKIVDAIIDPFHIKDVSILGNFAI